MDGLHGEISISYPLKKHSEMRQSELIQHHSTMADKYHGEKVQQTPQHQPYSPSNVQGGRGDANGPR